MTKRRAKKLFGYTSMAPIYSGVSEMASLLEETVLSTLEDKWKDVFPFGFLICPSAQKKNVNYISSARIDRKMDIDVHGYYYANDTAIIITLAMYHEEIGEKLYMNDFTDENPITPSSNIRNSKLIIGRELSFVMPLALKKQVKNYPEIKPFYEEFISDMQNLLIHGEWIQEVNSTENLELKEDEDPEICLNKSHKIFKKYFSHEIYTNYTDEETPFGSDTGFDTLNYCIDEFEKNNSVDFYKLSNKLIGEIYKLDEENEYLTSITNLAIALSEIKLTGKLSRKMEIISSESLDILNKITNNSNFNLQIISGDFNRFKEEHKHIEDSKI